MIDETLIRDVVSEVLGRLETSGNSPISTARAPAGGIGGRDGIFQTVDDAVAAARAAQKRLVDAGLEKRAVAVQCIRDICLEHKEELGKFELAETQIGRLDHKIAKLINIATRVPGMEMVTTEAVSGDHGLGVTEHAPFGVIGVITPVTHSAPTLACNAIMMISAGNTLVVNPHPGGVKSAVKFGQMITKRIREKTGLDNLVCVLENPTIETANEIFTHPGINMLCITGGPGVVKAAMASNKKAVVAGPGNPPVVVDETADIEKAAAGIVLGAAWDNNLLCIGEKEVFVVAGVADQLLDAFGRHGGYQLTKEQMDGLAKITIHYDEKSGHYVADKKFVGKDPQVIADAIGITLPRGVELLYGEVDESNPFLPSEQMMPVLPVVRCANVDQAIELAIKYEHGFGHTAIIWSKNVNNMTKMGKAVDTTIFIKNGPCVAGLGAGGEGFSSFSIATPTGEGVTSPLTFTRFRRCVMVDDLRII
jgi:aldehyde dehydrogenase